MDKCRTLSTYIVKYSPISAIIGKKKPRNLQFNICHCHRIRKQTYQYAMKMENYNNKKKKKKKKMNKQETQ